MFRSTERRNPEAARYVFPRYTMKAVRVSLVAVCMVLACQAADDGSERVYSLGDDGITPPRLIHQVSPEYKGAKGVSVKGSVAVAIVVSSEGLPKDPHVLQGLDPEVDRSAVEAIRQWRFAPAQKDKKPVAVKVTVEVQFRSM